ncbi:MAG: TolC family protein, partial [Pseudomonadota bacterium]
MSYVLIESFPKCRGMRETRAARNYLRAALLCIVAGMPLSAFPADSPALVESRSAPQVATPLKALVSEALQNNPEIQAARKEREAAQHRVAPAGALDDPMLEAGIVSLPLESLSFRREDMTMKMLGLSQKLPYPGKRGLRQDI